MVINLIVGFVTLLMAGFVAVWIFVPHLRRWIEEPKYRFLEHQRQFPTISRDVSPVDSDESRRPRPVAGGATSEP